MTRRLREIHETKSMRTICLTLSLVAGVMTSAPSARAVTIAVGYSLSGQVFTPLMLSSTFSGSATIYYQGSGLATLSPGPVSLVSGPHLAVSNILLPGVAQLSAMNSIRATGPGTLASNGVATLMLQRITTSGYVHCLDLTPLGCQTFLMLPSSVPFPQTGNLSNVALVLQNPGLSQPPATLVFSAMNAGGNATFGTWTFTEIVGSRAIVPEPATGTLVGMGLLVSAIVAGSLERRRRGSNARRQCRRVGSRGIGRTA